MTTLSPGLIFPQTGLNDKPKPVFKRAKYGTQGEQWPHESPLAGEYDVENSPAKLVMLNNRRPKLQNRLRGKANRNPSPINPQRHSVDSPRTNNNRHEPCYDNSTPRFNAPPFKPRSAWDSCSSSTTSEELVRPASVCSHPWDGCAEKVPDGWKTNRYLKPPKVKKSEVQYLWTTARIYSMGQLKVLKQRQYRELLLKQSQTEYDPRTFLKYLQYVNGSRKQQYGIENHQKRPKSSPPDINHRKGDGKSSRQRKDSESSDIEHSHNKSLKNEKNGKNGKNGKSTDGKEKKKHKSDSGKKKSKTGESSKQSNANSKGNDCQSSESKSKGKPQNAKPKDEESRKVKSIPDHSAGNNASSNQQSDSGNNKTNKSKTGKDPKEKNKKETEHITKKEDKTHQEFTSDGQPKEKLKAKTKKKSVQEPNDPVKEKKQSAPKGPNRIKSAKSRRPTDNSKKPASRRSSDASSHSIFSSILSLSSSSSSSSSSSFDSSRRSSLADNEKPDDSRNNTSKNDDASEPLDTSDGYLSVDDETRRYDSQDFASKSDDLDHQSNSPSGSSMENKSEIHQNNPDDHLDGLSKQDTDPDVKPEKTNNISKATAADRDSVNESGSEMSGPSPISVEAPIEPKRVAPLQRDASLTVYFKDKTEPEPSNERSEPVTGDQTTVRSQSREPQQSPPHLGSPSSIDSPSPLDSPQQSPRSSPPPPPPKSPPIIQLQGDDYDVHIHDDDGDHSSISSENFTDALSLSASKREGFDRPKSRLGNKPERNVDDDEDNSEIAEPKSTVAEPNSDDEIIDVVSADNSSNRLESEHSSNSPPVASPEDVLYNQTPQKSSTEEELNSHSAGQSKEQSNQEYSIERTLEREAIAALDSAVPNDGESTSEQKDDVDQIPTSTDGDRPIEGGQSTSSDALNEQQYVQFMNEQLKADELNNTGASNEYDQQDLEGNKGQSEISIPNDTITEQ